MFEDGKVTPYLFGNCDNCDDDSEGSFRPKYGHYFNARKPDPDSFIVTKGRLFNLKNMRYYPVEIIKRIGTSIYKLKITGIETDFIHLNYKEGDIIYLDNANNRFYSEREYFSKFNGKNIEIEDEELR